MARSSRLRKTWTGTSKTRSQSQFFEPGLIMDVVLLLNPALPAHLCFNRRQQRSAFQLSLVGNVAQQLGVAVALQQPRDSECFLTDIGIDVSVEEQGGGSRGDRGLRRRRRLHPEDAWIDVVGFRGGQATRRRAHPAKVPADGHKRRQGNSLVS